jgi:hypothetical protein
MVSTVLTGVAVVGVGVGAVLFLTAKPRETAASPAPRISGGVGPAGAELAASWVF